MDVRNTAWRKCSHSPDWDDCVEVAPAAGLVAVRDSKDPDGPVIVVTRRTLNQLLARLTS